jgi:hypothetical protein
MLKTFSNLGLTEGLKRLAFSLRLKTLFNKI